MRRYSRKRQACVHTCYPYNPYCPSARSIFTCYRFQVLWIRLDRWKEKLNIQAYDKNQVSPQDASEAGRQLSLFLENP